MGKIPRAQWKQERSEAAAANEARRVQMLLERDLATDSFDDAKNATASAELLAAIQQHHESDPHAA